MNKIKRQPLKYYGGKWSIAPWIIKHFPRHESYIEPMGGSAAVLLNKPRSKLETYNDIDSNVVNYFRVIRDDPAGLARQLEKTPWARAEYDLAIDYDDPYMSEMERARRFAVRSFMSIRFDSGKKLSGWRNRKKPDGRREDSAFDLLKVSKILNIVAKRLIGVQIENRDWYDVARDYANVDSLIYCDPPYPKNVRTVKNAYFQEWSTDDHELAAARWATIPGSVVVSSYWSPLYHDLYDLRGWRRFDSEPVQTNSGGKRVESIWLNVVAAERLAGDFGPLFRNGEKA